MRKPSDQPFSILNPELLGVDPGLSHQACRQVTGSIPEMFSSRAWATVYSLGRQYKENAFSAKCFSVVYQWMKGKKEMNKLPD